MSARKLSMVIRSTLSLPGGPSRCAGGGACTAATLAVAATTGAVAIGATEGGGALGRGGGGGGAEAGTAPPQATKRVTAKRGRTVRIEGAFTPEWPSAAPKEHRSAELPVCSRPAPMTDGPPRRPPPPLPPELRSKAA